MAKENDLVTCKWIHIFLSDYLDAFYIHTEDAQYIFE